MFFNHCTTEDIVSGGVLSPRVIDGRGLGTGQISGAALLEPFTGCRSESGSLRNSAKTEPSRVLRSLQWSLWPHSLLIGKDRAKSPGLGQLGIHGKRPS